MKINKAVNLSANLKIIHINFFIQFIILSSKIKNQNLQAKQRRVFNNVVSIDVFDSLPIKINKCQQYFPLFFRMETSKCWVTKQIG